MSSHSHRKIYTNQATNDRRMIDSSTVIELLIKYKPFDDVEKHYVKRVIDFAKSHIDITDKKNQIGHVTASGWVLNKDGTQALLLHHLKLNRWLQPGGHVEKSDHSLADAALREVTEETGITDINLKMHGLFDVDVHEIPANNNTCSHVHFDVRFLFQSLVDNIKVSNESIGYQWVPITEISNLLESMSLSRMAEKSNIRLIESR